MKRFRFRLQRLLSLAGAAERDRRLALLVARRRLAEAEASLTAARAAEGEAEAAARSGLSAGAEPAAWLAWRAHLDRLRSRVALEGERVRAAAEEVEAAASAWRLAWREEAVYRRLRQRRLAQYTAEWLRAEQTAFDEQGAQRFVAGRAFRMRGEA